MGDPMTPRMERAVRILEQHGPMTREQFNQYTGIPIKRSGALLSQAAAYGHITKLSDYRPHHLPQFRMSAIYAAKPPNDNEAPNAGR
jgi:hypothetical protein